MHLISVHLTGVYLTGVHLTGVHFTGVHLISVHLMDMRFIMAKPWHFPISCRIMLSETSRGEIIRQDGIS